MRKKIASPPADSLNSILFPFIHHNDTWDPPVSDTTLLSFLSHHPPVSFLPNPDLLLLPTPARLCHQLACIRPPALAAPTESANEAHMASTGVQRTRRWWRSSSPPRLCPQLLLPSFVAVHAAPSSAAWRALLLHFWRKALDAAELSIDCQTEKLEAAAGRGSGMKSRGLRPN